MRSAPQKVYYGKFSPSKRYALLWPPETLTLIDFLLKAVPSLKTERLQWLIEFGAVYVNSVRTTKKDHEVSKGDMLRIHFEPKRYAFDISEIRKNIVFENENFLVINKISGVPVHATVDNLHENILAVLGEKYLLTHRLDVPTSGLLVFAKNKNYQALFNKLIGQRKVEKIYQVLTQHPVKSGLMKHFIQDGERAPRKVRLTIQPHESAQWKECLLEVTRCEKISEGTYESRVILHTGRTHQIRAQFGFEKTPLIGDVEYGGVEAKVFGLHAESLRFACPQTQKLFELTMTKQWLSLK